jgi:hypothetical protein
MLANASYAGLALSLLLPYTLMLAYAMMRACKEERASRRTVIWLVPVSLCSFYEDIQMCRCPVCALPNLSGLALLP